MIADRAAITISDQLVDQLAERVAHHVARRLRDETDDGYLDPAAAAGYLGVARKRIHDLTSAGALVPDGRDGRKPLYRKHTLDAYVQSGGLIG